MKSNETANVFFTWGIVSAISILIFRRKMNLQGCNILLIYTGTNVKNDKQRTSARSNTFQLISEIFLTLHEWDRIEYIDYEYSYVNKNNSLQRLLQRFKINHTHKPFSHGIRMRKLANQLDNRYKSINCISSDNIQDWKYFYGKKFIKHYLVEHGSPFYRTNNYDSANLTIFKKSILNLKHFIFLAKNIPYTLSDPIVNIDDPISLKTNIYTINTIYNQFLKKLESDHHNDFTELMLLKEKLKDNKITIFGPFPEIVDNHFSIIESMLSSHIDDSPILVKCHHSDSYNEYGEIIKKLGKRLITIESSIINSLPLEFLLWYFSNSVYIGSPTMGAFYAKNLFNKETYIKTSGVNIIDKLYNDEYKRILTQM